MLKQQKVNLWLAGLLFLLGVALVTQLKLTSNVEQKLATQSVSDLVEIVDKLDTENSYLEQQIEKSKQDFEHYLKSTEDNSLLEQKISKQIASLKALLGVSPVAGFGVKIFIQDKENLLTDFDFYQLVNEIKASGSWALAINGQRLKNNSAFWRQKGKIYLDGKLLQPPYNVKAVGKSSLIFQSLTLPRGILDRLSTIKGVKIKTQKTKVVLPALAS